MFSIAAILLVVSMGGRDPAQDHGHLMTSRLARAEQLQDSLRRVDLAAALLERARADVGSSGPIRVLIRAGGGSAQSVADGVWARWRGNGFPDSLLARFVLAEEGIASRDDTLGKRRVVAFGRPGGLTASDRHFAAYMADNAAWSLSEALLDSTMHTWLEGRFDPRVAEGFRYSLVISDLKIGEWQSTRGCLSGSTGDCVVYMGIEPHPDIRLRFPIADIRRHFAATINVGQSLARGCVNGDDSACAAAWRPGLNPPASLNARWSLLNYVRERYGPDALARVVLDTASTVGARFHDATGRSPAELAADWRNWLLPPTARWPLAAGGLQASTSVFAVLLLLAMAARSGRWRE